MNYLVFRLYGPMVSWGEIAIGESRSSALYPSKSAVIGLLAAALGIRREEDTLHRNLATQYMQAVKVLNTGQLLKDYHTTQAPDSAGKVNYRTRRDELVLGRSRLGTILSSREYRTDAHTVVAISALAGAKFDLPVLLNALKRPKFHLYLGRKSCPLAAPLDVEIISASGFRQALDQYKCKPLMDQQPEWRSDKRWLPTQKQKRYYWEGTMDDFSKVEQGFEPAQVQELTRYDKPVSRKRWQFEKRSEYLWLCDKEVN